MKRGKSVLFFVALAAVALLVFAQASFVSAQDEKAVTRGAPELGKGAEKSNEPQETGKSSEDLEEFKVECPKINNVPYCSFIGYPPFAVSENALVYFKEGTITVKNSGEEKAFIFFNNNQRVSVGSDDSFTVGRPASAFERLGLRFREALSGRNRFNVRTPTAVAGVRGTGREITEDLVGLPGKRVGWYCGYFRPFCYRTPVAVRAVAVAAVRGTGPEVTEELVGLEEEKA